jgi:hypothetical protein
MSGAVQPLNVVASAAAALDGISAAVGCKPLLGAQGSSLVVGQCLRLRSDRWDPQRLLEAGGSEGQLPVRPIEPDRPTTQVCAWLW